VPPYRAARLDLDATGNRIRAYLASVRPLGGVADLGTDEFYQRGRSLIERLALSAEDDALPSLRLTAAQCADVVRFIAMSEPIEPSTWWEDPEGAPSHIAGFTLLMNAVESSLRGPGRRS
jgi:hypothetical protein